MVDVAVAVVDEIDGAARKRITDLIEDDVFYSPESILSSELRTKAAPTPAATM